MCNEYKSIIKYNNIIKYKNINSQNKLSRQILVPLMLTLNNIVIRELKQRQRRPRGQHLGKNEFIFYLRISQLSRSVPCAYRSQNLLKLYIYIDICNLQRVLPITADVKEKKGNKCN